MNETHARGANRKLLGVLGLVIGIGVVVAALVGGSEILSFLPYLLVLACPLMMLFMMGSMGSMGSMGHNHIAASHRQPDGMSDLLPDLQGLSREEQVRALRGELTRMSWRQEALRQDLEQLEAEHRPEHAVDSERMLESR